MQKRKINTVVRWWMTKYLPPEDIFGLPLLKKKDKSNIIKFEIKRWLIYPIRRRLARYYLLLIKKYSDIKVIAVTGSAGKSTTVRMLDSILALRGKTIASRLSVDPVYNLPNTILMCDFSTKYLILEMGVEYPGEMDYYLWLAKPDIGVITNIFPTHTQFFGDEQGVFREKSKLVKSLGKSDFSVLNHQNKFLKYLGQSTKSHNVFFGDSSEVAASQRKIQKNNKTSFRLTLDQDPKKSVVVNLPIIGFQFVENALAASAVAKILSVSLNDIKLGLENFTPDDHRMKLIKHKSGALILDDSYNNNPNAAIESIKSLSYLGKNKNKVVVFGDMLELGKYDEKYHRKLGKILAKSKITKLICVGKSVKFTAEEFKKSSIGGNVEVFKNYENSVNAVKKQLQQKNIILIKGSRSVKLDLLVKKLR